MDLTMIAAGGHGPLSAVIAEYYRGIDRRNLESALACFAPDAVYHRPGYADFVGFDAISTYYRDGRVIADGTHEIESMIEAKDAVAVQGGFRGTSRSGLPLSVRFADFWSFSGLVVVHRNTYFDAPAV